MHWIGQAATLPAMVEWALKLQRGDGSGTQKKIQLNRVVCCLSDCGRKTCTFSSQIERVRRFFVSLFHTLFVTLFVVLIFRVSNSRVVGSQFVTLFLMLFFVQCNI